MDDQDDNKRRLLVQEWAGWPSFYKFYLTNLAFLDGRKAISFKIPLGLCAKFVAEEGMGGAWPLMLLCGHGFKHVQSSHVGL